MDTIYVEDCCEILDSRRVPITAFDREEGEYPYYGANGIQGHVANYIFDDELVLLAEDGGNFGSKEKPIAYRVSGKCWVNNHAHVLKPKAELNVDYLCYSLMFYKVDGIVNGATRQKLTQAAMRKMQIPLRIMEEQLQIVDELNHILKIKEQRQQELQLLDTLIKARFVELFGDILCNDKGWPIYSLDTISSSRLGKMLDAKRNTGSNSFPYLANFNVQWFEFDLSELHEMDFNDADREEFSLKDGDLLVTEGGEVGRCAIWHNEVTDCYFQKALHRVRCDKNIILPEYLAWWFKFHSDFNGFEDIVGGKATIAHLPGIKLKKLQIEVPDINVQKDFVSFWREIDKSKVAVQKALNKTQILFDSLMQKYFG